MKAPGEIIATAGEQAKKFLHAAFVRPYARPAQAIASAALWTWKKYRGIFLEAIPGRVLNLAEDMILRGEALCRGRKAPLTFVPGAVLRSAGEWGRFFAGSPPGGGGDALIKLGVLVGFGTAAAAVLVAAASIVVADAFLPFLALALVAAGFVAYPAVVCALTIAGAAGFMAVGAALSLPRALCNIPVGFQRRREALEKEAAEEKRKKERAMEATPAELAAMPALERSLRWYFAALPEATPRERVEWFEALKEKFSEDFAAAAVPEPGDLSPVLENAVKISGPLQFKNFTTAP